MNLISAAACVCLTAAPALAADVYKCPTAGGKVEFRDRPCDGAAGQKLDVRPSTAGTGSIEDVRAQDAAFNARMKARRDAQDNTDAAIYRAQERQFQQERAHQDSVDMTQAIREGNNAQGWAPGYGYNPWLPRPERKVVVIVQPPAPPPRTVPAKPPPK